MAKRRLKGKAIPHFPDSLRLHSSRAKYHANIWRKCLQRHPQILSPDGYSWTKMGTLSLVSSGTNTN